MGLTDTALKKLKPEEKPYRVSDGQGLFVEVAPTGGKLWRWAYRFAGKQKLMALGAYPGVTLAEARERHQRGRRLLATGLDPMTERKIEKVRALAKNKRQGNEATQVSRDEPESESDDAHELVMEITPDSPFRLLALHWFHHWQKDKEAKYRRRTRSRLELNLFPALGALPISRIEPKDIIRMAKAVEERGVKEVARRSLELTKQVFEYGIAHDYVKTSPAAAVRPKLVLQPYKAKNQTRVPAHELPDLLGAIDAFQGRKLVMYAMQLMAMTFLRTSELLGAEWREFDLKNKQWKIPAERMKMDQDHIVPLSDQALKVLAELKKLSGTSQYVFPGDYKTTKTMNTNAILEALYDMGYKGKQTGHGFRGIASTILHEKGYPHEHIEIQLAHTKKDKVSAAYNYALYLEPRARMMQEWADYLDKIRQPFSAK